MTHTVEVRTDHEAGVLIASCEEIGLNIEAGSVDELISQIDLALPDLVELNSLGNVSKYTVKIEHELRAQ